ncbi:MAG: hypothetical protein U0457_08990 [Candidatus Sericytochromatia bacterium]
MKYIKLLIILSFFINIAFQALAEDKEKNYHSLTINHKNYKLEDFMGEYEFKGEKIKLGLFNSNFNFSVENVNFPPNFLLTGTYNSKPRIQALSIQFKIIDSSNKKEASDGGVASEPLNTFGLKPEVFNKNKILLLKPMANLTFGLLNENMRDKLDLLLELQVNENYEIVKDVIFRTGDGEILKTSISEYFYEIDRKDFIDNINLAIKNNMHTLQTAIETFGVDNYSYYPKNLDDLFKEANEVSTPYWKILTNPINKKIDKNNAFADYKEYKEAKDKKVFAGFILYEALDLVKSRKDESYVGVKPSEDFYKKYPIIANKYKIFGVDSEGNLLKNSDKEVFYLSN